MSDTGHWNLPQGISEPPDDAFGFLYKITNLTTDKYYIGIKQMVKTIKRPPLKGKKRRRTAVVQTDWKKYCSSSGIISEDVQVNKDNYVFDILEFVHGGKRELQFAEASYFVKSGCLFDERCYNEMFNYRLRFKK
jgi:hypothetical protein